MDSIRILMFLLALVCVSSALTSVDEVVKAKKEEEISLRQMYADMDKGLKNFIRENIKSAMRFIGEKSQEVNLSNECKGNALKLLTGIRDLKFWALDFIDATGKPSDGLMIGNINSFGNYDQCLNASVLKKNGALDFRGQYCLISVAANLPKVEITPDAVERVALVKKVTQNLTEMIGRTVLLSEIARPEKVKFGLCFPSGCGTNDVDNLIKNVAKQVVFLNITLDYCETEDDLKYFTPTRILILCVYSFFIFLVIISSVIEHYSASRKMKFEHPVLRGLMCFSLPCNFQKFTSTKITEENLSFLNGIRVLTLFNVILGHHYLVKLGSQMFRNILPQVMVSSKRFFFQILINGTFTVDVFFFIGGFLNCYMRGKKDFTHFSFSSSFKILIHRLLRIYPVYIFIILLTFLINFRGPLVHAVEEIAIRPCRTEWWRNLLFINNVYSQHYQCIPHSWYLAADMQFFFVSLFTIPLLYRYPKSGVLAHLAIILLSTVFTAVRAWIYEILPTSTLGLTMEATRPTVERTFDEQLSSYPHAASYFGGVLLGFFLAKKRSLKLSKKFLTFGWIVASTLFLTMLFVTKKWMGGVPYTRLESAVHFSLSRTLYSWSVGWLIFCCFAGYGGFINHILSWKIWIPLNRLCLSAYLLSAVVQTYYFGNLRSPQDFHHNIEIWGFFGDLAVTCLVALPIVMLFESPFIALEKVIFHKKESDTKLKENEMQEKDTTKNENGISSDMDKSHIKI